MIQENRKVHLLRRLGLLVKAYQILLLIGCTVEIDHAVDTLAGYTSSRFDCLLVP